MKVESGCKAIGCHFDVNSDSCGYFQIKEGYWHDCGSPGTSKLFIFNLGVIANSQIQRETMLDHIN